MALASTGQLGVHLGRGILAFGFGFRVLLLLHPGSHIFGFHIRLGRRVRNISKHKERGTGGESSTVDSERALCSRGNRTRRFLTFCGLVLRKALRSGALST